VPVLAFRRRHFVLIRDCHTDSLYARLAGGMASAMACVISANATWRELTAAHGTRGIVWVENDKTMVAFRGMTFG